MTPPKRRAPFRTVDAIAEDLRQARAAGGIAVADESVLAATIDLLLLVGVSPDETPLARAHDLLRRYVRTGCERYGVDPGGDRTAKAAVVSLRKLLLRAPADTTLAATVRRSALATVGHDVTTDSVRHREDKIIDDIAREVFADLEKRRLDEPQSLENAIHRLAPIAADLRQQLHDGLCLIFYKNLPPKDPQERNAIEGFYRQAIVNLGDLLLASQQLIDLSRKTRYQSEDEYWFAHRARYVRSDLFNEADDRAFMLAFARRSTGLDWEVAAAALLGSERGDSVYCRWIAWINSCYPECAFERSWDRGHMCSPHSYLTLLYELEIRYDSAGFNDPNPPENQPIMHQRVMDPSLGSEYDLPSLGYPAETGGG